MSYSMPWTFDEVPYKGELLCLECRIHFDCDDGDRWTPPHCAIDQVDVLEGSCELRDIAYELAKQRADEIISAFSERQADAEEAAQDDYYDRKRDELMGC